MQNVVCIFLIFLCLSSSLSFSIRHEVLEVENGGSVLCIFYIRFVSISRSFCNKILNNIEQVYAIIPPPVWCLPLINPIRKQE